MARNNASTEHLRGIISRFPETRVLVIGDLIVDEFIWGKVSRISPEAPVPVVHVQTESIHLGGATNVVNNILSMGGQALVCGVVGRDRMGDLLINELESHGVDPGGIIRPSRQSTSVKTRIIAHNQQVVRYDRERIRDIAPSTVKKINAYLNKHISEIDAVIISDYGKGVITADLLRKIMPLLKKKNIFIAVDPKTDNFRYYRHVSLITPNNFEAGEAVNIKITNKKEIIKVGKILLDRLKCRAVLITWGEKGMVLFQDSGDIFHIPTTAREVYDVTGAGDTVVGSFALCLGAGATMKEAAILSNDAAGIVVGKLGSATVTSDELFSAYERHEEND